jgi:hypothetical protein
MFGIRANILFCFWVAGISVGMSQDHLEVINLVGNSAANEYGAVWNFNELIFNRNDELKTCISFDDFQMEDTRDIASNTSFVSTNRGKNLIALTLTNFTGKALEIEQGLLRMKLIIGKLKMDKSIAPDRYQLFPHQLPEYNYGFPCFSPDGNKLYFVADIPGGYGGLDIYVSRASVGGWTFPENLGPAINTSGNEVTPFFDGAALYFASDISDDGSGTFNIFKSEWLDGDFQRATVLPFPFNTAYNDWGYYDGGQAVLISSDRMGGKGGFDLYALRPKETPIDVPQNIPFSIQLSAGSNNPDLKSFKDLEVYGPIWVIQENDLYKVRLGNFERRSIAMETLEIIKQKGYAGFIVEGFMPDTYDYRIQLAAYQDVKWFNNLLVEDLGKLESETKGNLTIQLLTEIKDLEQAENLLFEAKKRGFSDAFIQHKVDYGWERLKNGY